MLKLMLALAAAAATMVFGAPAAAAKAVEHGFETRSFASGFERQGAPVEAGTATGTGRHR